MYPKCNRTCSEDKVLKTTSETSITEHSVESDQSSQEALCNAVETCLNAQEGSKGSNDLDRNESHGDFKDSRHCSPAVNGVQSYGNFDLLQRIEVESAESVIEEWRSRTTGLTVVHIDYDTPIVDGYFAVRSEIFNDSGCPHTLEHLIFMGSERYPYKGILDKLANRGFANGTNAWTGTADTVYTVCTAGDQGFLQLLPVYVDHILFPTLTESAFTTEVYHVDQAGHDAGVVYCEMQGRENAAFSIIWRELMRLIHPEGSGYRSETGGLMSALRTLDIQQIRDYHTNYYVPHNLCLIVAGKVTGGADSLLSLIQQQIEPTLVENGYDKGHRPPGWKRPFAESPSATRKPYTKQSVTVSFPDTKEEKTGKIWMSFVGPQIGDYLSKNALRILYDYLNSTPVAPLNKEFVEIENPLSTGFSFWTQTWNIFHDLIVAANSIPVENLETFCERFTRCLENIAIKGIDMARMQTLIKRDRRQLRSSLENSKGRYLYSKVISDFRLGAEDGSELQDTLDPYRFHNELLKWDSRDWVALLRKYFIDSPSITIRGKPSKELAEKLERDEKERVDAQVKTLGPEGLARKKEELQKAKAENEKPIPDDILTSFPIPDVETISWIPVKSFQEPLSGAGVAKCDSDIAKHIISDGLALPFFVHYEHVQSDFVEINAYLSLASLPDHLRPLMAVYEYVFFSSPVFTSTGEKLSSDDVVAKLVDETVSYSCSIELGDNFCVSIEVEKERYEDGVRWLKDLIYGMEFDLTKLQTNAAQIVQGLPEDKRSASVVLSSFLMEHLYDNTSMDRAYSLAEQARAIPELLKQLKTDPDGLCNKFKDIQQYMTDPSGMRFSAVGNVLELSNPKGMWMKYFGDKLQGVWLQPIRLDYERLNDTGRNLQRKAIAVDIPGKEDFYAKFYTNAINGFGHSDEAALIVALQILNSFEGLFWVQIRGQGLSYNTSITSNVQNGTLKIEFSRSTNCLEAFRQAAKVVEGLVNGTTTLRDTDMDAAKSAQAYLIASSVAHPFAAASMSLYNQVFRGLSQDYHRELLARCQKVTKEEVLAALKQYCLPLFDPATSIAAVATPPGKLEATIEGLRELGYEVERRSVDEFVIASSESSDGDGDESVNGNAVTGA